MKMLLVVLLVGYLVMLSNVVTCYNVPECHKGIMSLFRWCEQSDCTNNCTCLSVNHVCKQICGDKYCGMLFCSSPKTCFQSVLVSGRAKSPKIEKFISHSPIAQQDCSQGKCKLIKALRYDDTFTRTFQSCSEGSCGHLYSTGDHAKQFCGNCNKMTCTGKHSQNCTQLCILGVCKQVVCHAKTCKQLCSHESVCNLTCGRNTEVCEQTCSHGSKCIMNCYGKKCLQSCAEGTNCTRNSYTTTVMPTTLPVTTTSKLTTVAPTTGTTKLSSTKTDVSPELVTHLTLKSLENTLWLKTTETSNKIPSSSQKLIFLYPGLQLFLILVTLYLSL